MRIRVGFVALLCCAAPVLAQTTTVTTQQQQPAAPPPPPPPATSTTVTTQPAPSTQPAQPAPSPQPAQPTTQVVVNPNPPSGAAPAAPNDAPVSTSSSTRIHVADTTAIVTERPPRPALETVAVDALYGGLAGAIIGAGVMLIDQGNHIARDLTVGAGAGILAGAAYGIYDASTTDVPRRAAADPNPIQGTRAPAMAMTAAHF